MIKNDTDTIYILGAGIIGLALAAHLVNNDKKVILGRTSTHDRPQGSVIVKVKDNKHNDIQARVDVISLAKLSNLDGIIIITAKAYANELIATHLKEKKTNSPIIIMQNGIGVEQPYRQAGFTEIYRCVLYSGGQKTDTYEVQFRSIKSSPIGIIAGNEDTLQACVEQISTTGFTFHAELRIQAEIWMKGIINSVFNTICPLLETDNGIFFHDSRVAEMAKDIINECIKVAQALNIDLNQQELMEQVLTISEGSAGQLVSTLQDIQNQRETEIGSLNLEIARIADTVSPKVDVSNTKLLGEMIRIKASMKKSQF